MQRKDSHFFLCGENVCSTEPMQGMAWGPGTRLGSLPAHQVKWGRALFVETFKESIRRWVCHKGPETHGKFLFKLKWLPTACFPNCHAMGRGVFWNPGSTGKTLPSFSSGLFWVFLTPLVTSQGKPSPFLPPLSSRKPINSECWTPSFSIAFQGTTHSNPWVLRSNSD